MVKACAGGSGRIVKYVLVFAKAFVTFVTYKAILKICKQSSLMKRLRKEKTLRAATAIVMIFTNVALLPFAGVFVTFFLAQTAIAHQFDANNVEISKPAISDAASYFVSPANQEQAVASCKRAAQTVSPIPDRLIYFAQYRQLSESRAYLKTNDLPYNLPRIIYLLSSSEHATEG